MADMRYITVDMACPVCKYNLRGLPMDHACPECGFKILRHVSADTMPDPHRTRRDRFIEEFDALMEERQKAEDVRLLSEELTARQLKLIETWERLAERMNAVLDKLEKGLPP
jgi:hypothetical protein